ncbi:MAG: hypothetical protein E7535_08220 [Ruminococcaceae bacterium]|nr:hypothetical protein [Oscillospiraceae bacterium]
MNENIRIYVTDPPFCAKGDGKTNDRKAIQAALDLAYSKGGGTVILTENKVFLSGSIIIRDNTELHFEEGAELFQSSSPEDYVKPSVDGYIPYKPQYGHNLYPDIKWSHLWYYNFPFIFAPEGTKNFKITGKGTVRMMPDDNPELIMKLCPIGFYRADGFIISDIHITDYHSYALMPFTSRNGLIKNVRIDNWSHGNGDGICLMNCQNIRITGCRMHTGDDSVYIFSSYKDPRKSEWWSSDEPQASLNIEIDNNHLRSNHCKAFGMILWGIDCPDQSKIEVRNLFIHDNFIETLGNWNYNPYTTRNGFPPVTNVRFENNTIEAIEPNFFETQITDMSFFHSSKSFLNGGFENGGMVFWSYKKNSNPDSVGIGTYETEHTFSDGGSYGSFFGYIDHLDEGDAALYQGLYISASAPCCFWARLRTSGEPCRMFVRSLDTGETVITKDFSNTEWEDVQLDFTVPESANYHIGIERGDAKKGRAEIDNAVLLGNNDAAFGYKRVGTDYQRPWKPLYYFNPDLWKNEE